MPYTTHMARTLTVSLICLIGCSRPTTWSTPPEADDSGSGAGEEGSDGSLDTENVGDAGTGDESGDDSSDDGGTGSAESGDGSADEADEFIYLRSIKVRERFQTLHPNHLLFANLLL